VDGTLRTTMAGAPGEATLSAEDRLAIDGILRSDAMLIAMTQGFACEASTVDLSYHFILELGGPSFDQDVSGCLNTGPEGNDAQRLWEILQAY
jgi:hypothetical protein